jgi:hypothetical protein
MQITPRTKVSEGKMMNDFTTCVHVFYEMYPFFVNPFLVKFDKVQIEIDEKYSSLSYWTDKKM